MLIIETEDAQRILNYLMTRPYREVYELVNILMTLKQVPSTQDTGNSFTGLAGN